MRFANLQTMREGTTASSAGAFAALSVLAISACGGVEPARAERNAQELAIPVRVTAVRIEPVERPIRAAGILGAKHETTLSFKVAGLVKSVAVDEGSRVRRGQVLASIDTTEYGAAAAVAKQAMSEAERGVSRARTLQQGNAIGIATLQSAETELEVLRAKTAAADFNVRQTKIVAPEAGVILQRLVQVGEVVGPERGVFVLSGIAGGMVVRGQLTDRDALDTRVDAPVKVVIDARPETVLSGRVARTATAASPLTGTFEVEVAIEDAGLASLPSGLTAKIEIAREAKALATVPLSALVDGQGREGAVFLVRGERAERFLVQVAFLYADRAALAVGPQAGELVVDRGATRVRDGALVRVLR